MTLEDRQKKTIQGLIHLNCYTYLHDDLIAGNGLTHKTKMMSKNLVDELEKGKFKEAVMSLHKMDGQSYLECVEVVEETVECLSHIPIEYWAEITRGLKDLRVQIEAKK